MPLTTCTLTGVDQFTDFDKLLSLSRQHPFSEWGALLSKRRAGGGRYPSLDWIEKFGAAGKNAGLNTALHICGEAVHAIVDGDEPITRIASLFGRIQLNFNATKGAPRVMKLQTAMDGWPSPIITQDNQQNAQVTKLLSSTNHQVLFDSSCGRGKLPKDWRRPIRGKLCGYAGGLGPGRISDALDQIALHAASRSFWIDMKSRIRTKADRFDLFLAEDALAETAAHTAS